MDIVQVEDKQQSDVTVTSITSIKINSAKEGADKLTNPDGGKTLLYPEGNYLEFQKKDWSEYIKGNFPDFKGNVENASTLLLSFADGIKATCKDKDLKTMLPFALVNSEGVINSPFISNDEYGFLIRLSQLERDSQNIEGNCSLQRKTGEVIFTGKIQDFYKLVGAEESHHHWFRKEKIDYKYPKHTPTDLSVVEYDSQEIEYQALEWQLKLAISESMTDRTVKLLKDRFDAAIQNRQAKTVTK